MAYRQLSPLARLAQRTFSSGATGPSSPLAGVTQLGKQVDAADSPDEATLERVPNPHPGTHYVTRFVSPEFTSLCPVTGQPDFAHLVLDYVAGDWLVESKSLKLFLTSFRNHRAFHEDCSVSLARRVQNTIDPVWLRLGAYWYPRGGIPIDVFYQSGPPPDGLWLPEQGVPTYRGRG